MLRRKLQGEESPGSTETRCRVTPGGREPRESATESKPPPEAFGRRGVRVKGCGKSAPRPWQQGRHGKPHREQNRIGRADGFGPWMRFRIVLRVGCARQAATPVPDEWPSIGASRGARGQNPAYRPSGPKFPNCPDSAIRPKNAPVPAKLGPLRGL